MVIFLRSNFCTAFRAGNFSKGEKCFLAVGVQIQEGLVVEVVVALQDVQYFSAALSIFT